MKEQNPACHSGGPSLFRCLHGCCQPQPGETAKENRLTLSDGQRAFSVLKIGNCASKKKEEETETQNIKETMVDHGPKLTC